MQQLAEGNIGFRNENTKAEILTHSKSPLDYVKNANRKTQDLPRDILGVSNQGLLYYSVKKSFKNVELRIIMNIISKDTFIL